VLEKQPRLSTMLIPQLLRRCYPSYALHQTATNDALLEYAKTDHFHAHFESKLENTTEIDEKSSHRQAHSEDLIDHRVYFGRYRCRWRGVDFLLYEMCHLTLHDSVSRSFFILWPKSSKAVSGDVSLTPNTLIHEAVKHSNKAGDEILVYDQRDWMRSASLARSVRDSSWDQVILDSSLKDAVTREVNTFFDSGDAYQSLLVPWKVRIHSQYHEALTDISHSVA
jgi:hypothetical protein